MPKKKILLLSDDLRMNSGIATMSREIAIGTMHKYDWVQMAGAITHPEKGKIINMDSAAAQASGIKDAKLVLYPVDGYGDEDILYTVIDRENPDVIMHFTDPRFWGWLYALERQIREKIPLVYLDIWDDIPYPMYNRSFYESCDLLMAISKQTDNINKWVMHPENCIRVDGWYDKNGELHPYPIKLTHDYIREIVNEISKYVDEKNIAKNPIKNINDPRIILCVDEFIELISKKLNGSIDQNENIITYNFVKSLLTNHFKNNWEKFLTSIEDDLNKDDTQSSNGISNGVKTVCQNIPNIPNTPVAGSSCIKSNE